MIYIQCSSCAKTNKVSNGLKFGILPYSAYCILIKCMRLWVLHVWEGGYLFSVCLTNKRTFWDTTNDFNEYFKMFRRYPKSYICIMYKEKNPTIHVIHLVQLNEQTTKTNLEYLQQNFEICTYWLFVWAERDINHPLVINELHQNVSR